MESFPGALTVTKTMQREKTEISDLNNRLRSYIQQFRGQIMGRNMPLQIDISEELLKLTSVAKELGVESDDWWVTTWNECTFMPLTRLPKLYSRESWVRFSDPQIEWPLGHTILGLIDPRSLYPRTHCRHWPPGQWVLGSSDPHGIQWSPNIRGGTVTPVIPK